MPNYDFSKALTPERFQDFATDMLQVREKSQMESFRKVKDGGIDMRTKKDKKVVIGQAKRYSNKNNLMKDLRKYEIEKVKKLNPDRYILITSIDFDDETKKEIIDLFEGYIKEPSDIIGNTDINRLLLSKEYEEIEMNYSELWFNSSRVFKYIIEKEINRKIYNASKEEFNNIKENEKTYIENEIYNSAKEILDQYNCLLITGGAGIGKTSLARHICHEYAKEGYKFVYAYNMDDVWNTYTDNKQIFFIDDFWGSIFKEQTDKTEEKKFQDVIDAIGKSQNKKLVLTSREYIIEKGFKEHPKIGMCLDKNKFMLKLENYSNTYKAKIYLKHISESGLDLQNVKILLDNCEEIIEHPMYNPRLIAEFIQRAARQTKLDANYNCYIQLQKYLNNPKEFIKDVFDEQTEVAKLILVLLFLRNWEVEVDDLKSQYYEYLNVDNQIGRREDFAVAMKQLSNDLIRIQEDEVFREYYKGVKIKGEIPILVKFLNPSIKEFVYKYLTENIDKYIQNIIESTSCLNTLLYISGTYEIQLRGTKECKIEVNEIQNIIIDKIIKDYEKLEYRYKKDIMDSPLAKENTELSKIDSILDIYNNNTNPKMKEFLDDKVNNIFNKIMTKEQELEYGDRIKLPYTMKNLLDTDIELKIDINKIIEICYNSIQYAEEFESMENSFQKFFPEETERFMQNKEEEIKRKLPKLLMDNAIFYRDRGYNQELEDLIYIYYPSILKRYNFKSSKRYESNLMYIENSSYDIYEEQKEDKVSHWGQVPACQVGRIGTHLK